MADFNTKRQCRYESNAPFLWKGALYLIPNGIDVLKKEKEKYPGNFEEKLKDILRDIFELMETEEGTMIKTMLWPNRVADLPLNNHK